MANPLTTKRNPIATAMVIISVALITAKLVGGLDLPWPFVLTPFFVGIAPFIAGITSSIVGVAVEATANIKSNNTK